MFGGLAKRLVLPVFLFSFIVCNAQLTDFKINELVEEEVSLIDSWVQLTDNQILLLVGILKDYEEELNGYYIRNNELDNFNKINNKLKRDKNKKVKSVLSKDQYKLYKFFDKNRKKSSKEYVKEVYDAIKGHPNCQKELYNYHTSRVLPVYNSISREIQTEMTNDEIFRLDSIGSEVYVIVDDYYQKLIKKKKKELSDQAVQDSLKNVTSIVSEGTKLYGGIKAKYFEDLEPQLNALTDYRLIWNADINEILEKYFQGSALNAILKHEETIDKMGLNKEIADQTILMLQPGAADRYTEFFNQYKSMVLEFDN